MVWRFGRIAHNVSQGLPLEANSQTLVFLSFGPIKTGTSLGGGLAVLHCAAAAAIDGVDINKTQNTRMAEYSETMKRIQESLYKHHSNFVFFIRAVKCTILNLLSYSRLGCGAVKQTIEFIGYDYGELVVSALRGFRAYNNRDLIKQLRQRPNSALLALMYRRLIYSDATMQSAAARKRRCRSFENHLVQKDNDHLIPRHLDGSAMNGWIFPVLVKTPQHTSEVLLKSGIDSPSGLTQLKPVSKSCCPRICAVFDHIYIVPSHYKRKLWFECITGRQLKDHMERLGLISGMSQIVMSSARLADG